MSVLLITSLGDIVIDLYTKECPKACLNFLKLCKIKYYNNCLFYDIQKDYLAQTGDPENTGKGGKSIFGIVNHPDEKYFKDEILPQLRHNKIGTVSTANLGPDLNNSTFFIQLADKNLPYLNDKHTIFGRVEEGFDVLLKINKAYVDKDSRPYQNIRIKHTIILEDPFDDPVNLRIPSQSPEIVRDVQYNRLEDDFKVEEYYKDQETEDKIKEKLQEHEAKNRALVLEILEDLPDADIKPPENVLFICKLNPVTQDDDLELIFSRFGPIKSCQVIRDWKTGDSLKYAFIEFEKVEDCTQAYFKMNGTVIDSRRIKVDFSQSIAKLWQNIKKNQMHNLKLDNNTNELILPNENKKFEIRQNRDFMIEDKNYSLVFENDDDQKYAQQSYANIEIDHSKHKNKNENYEYEKDRKVSKHSHHRNKRSRKSSSSSRSEKKKRYRSVSTSREKSREKKSSRKHHRR